jgi:hypothetical protein
MKINWTLLASVTSALAGVIGTVLTPVYGMSLTSSVAAVLQAVSGVLMAIGAFHVTSAAHLQAKAKIQARYSIKL